MILWARKNNYIISSDQVVRWHKKDALPRPKRVSLGRGRGFKSLYPKETKKQLLRLCELLRATRNLEHVRLKLWLEGYFVPCEAIRETIKTKGLKDFENAQKGKGQIFEIARKSEQDAKRIRRQLVKDTGLKTKKLSDPAFFDFFEGLQDALSGQTPLYEDLIAEKTGENTIEGQGAKVSGIDKLWRAAEMEEPLDEAFRDAANLVTLKAHQNALKKSNEAELIQAREDLLFLRNDLAKASEKLLKALSENELQVFALSNSEQLVKDQTLRQTAGVLLMLLTLRKKGVLFIDAMRAINSMEGSMDL